MIADIAVGWFLGSLLMASLGGSPLMIVAELLRLRRKGTR